MSTGTPSYFTSEVVDPKEWLIAEAWGPISGHKEVQILLMEWNGNKHEALQLPYHDKVHEVYHSVRYGESRSSTDSNDFATAP